LNVGLRKSPYKILTYSIAEPLELRHPGGTNVGHCVVKGMAASAYWSDKLSEYYHKQIMLRSLKDLYTACRPKINNTILTLYLQGGTSILSFTVVVSHNLTAEAQSDETMDQGQNSAHMIVQIMAIKYPKNNKNCKAKEQ
jgi:hypothetical protein